MDYLDGRGATRPRDATALAPVRRAYRMRLHEWARRHEGVLGLLLLLLAFVVIPGMA